MRYNLAVLNEQIDMYFSKKISSDELGQWAKTAYYDLLKGGYIEVDKLYSYPFIKEVTSLYSCSNEKEDSAFCKDKRLIEIQNVLKHQEDYIFSVTVRLPELPYKDVYKRQVLKYKNIIYLCRYNGKIIMTQLCRNVRQIELRGIAIHDRKTWSIMRAKDAIAHNRPGLGSSPRGSTKKGVIFRCHRHRKLLPFL